MSTGARHPTSNLQIISWCLLQADQPTHHIDQLPALTRPILFSSIGITTVPTIPVTTQSPLMAAMKPSSQPRAALMYAIKAPSYDNVVR